MARPALPPLDPERLKAALEKAAEARAAKSTLLRHIREGRVKLAAVIGDDYAGDRTAQRLQVLTLLRAVPGISGPAAKAFMDDAHISLERRVGGLGSRQKEAILTKYAGK